MDPGDASQCLKGSSAPHCQRRSGVAKRSSPGLRGVAQCRAATTATVTVALAALGRVRQAARLLLRDGSQRAEAQRHRQALCAAAAELELCVSSSLHWERLAARTAHEAQTLLIMLLLLLAAQCCGAH